MCLKCTFWLMLWLSHNINEVLKMPIQIRKNPQLFLTHRKSSTVWNMTCQANVNTRPFLYKYTNTASTPHKLDLSSGSKYVCPTSPDWCCYVTQIVIMQTNIDRYEYKSNTDKYEELVKWMQVCLPHFRLLVLLCDTNYNHTQIQIQWQNKHSQIQI